MPGISQKRFNSTIKGPSAEAFDLLVAHEKEINSAWSRAMREFDLSLSDVLPAGRLDLSALADVLRSCTYATFRKQVTLYGQTLARRGIRLASMFACCN